MTTAHAEVAVTAHSVRRATRVRCFKPACSSSQVPQNRNAPSASPRRVHGSWHCCRAAPYVECRHHRRGNCSTFGGVGRAQRHRQPREAACQLECQRRGGRRLATGRGFLRGCRHQAPARQAASDVQHVPLQHSKKDLIYTGMVWGSVGITRYQVLCWLCRLTIVTCWVAQGTSFLAQVICPD